MPVNNALGAPIETTPLTPDVNMNCFSFTADAKYVFTDDACPAEVFKYAYPAGGAVLKFIKPFIETGGIVATPVEHP